MYCSMADLNGKLGQVGSAIILIDAVYPLTALNEAMTAKIAKTITPKQGYLSKFEVVEELRNRLHDDYRTKPPTESLQADFDAVKVNLDKQKPMLDIAKVSSLFDPLEKYMEALAKNHADAFNPPLLPSFKTDLHDVVHSIPSISKNDIRRYGRVIVFDKFEKTVYDWLINNSPLFGFLLYEDFGLFYLSVPEVKKLIAAKTVEKTLNKFQRTAVSGGTITLTAAAIETAQQPVSSPPPASGGGSAPQTSGVGSASGKPIPITGVQKTENIKTIAKYLKSIGVTREGAIGFIGNILGESSANPRAAEKSSAIGGIGGIGLVQWTASRRRRLEEAAGNDLNKIFNISFQLDYLGKELASRYSAVLNKLKTSKSIEESTVLVLEKFEVPGTYLNRDKNPQAYEATKSKRIGYAKGAISIVDTVYG